MARFFSWIGRGIGSLVWRFLPWITGALVALGTIEFAPEMAAPLVGIAFCFIALWVMVRGFLPGKKKK